MSSQAARILAGAIRRGAQRHDEQQGRRVYRGTVTAVSPLAVDLLGVDLTLDDQDVEFAQPVTAYAASPGLVVGDMLALLEVEDGDWLAVSVIPAT